MKYVEIAEALLSVIKSASDIVGKFHRGELKDDDALAKLNAMSAGLDAHNAKYDQALHDKFKDAL